MNIAAPGVSYELIGTVPAYELTNLVSEQFSAFNTPVPQPLSPAAVRRGATLYRIYYTINVNHPTLPTHQVVSGLLMVPEQAPSESASPIRRLPLAIYNHGTLFNRRLAASEAVIKQADGWTVGSAETLLNIGIFADQGYAMLAADYVGCGINSIQEGYGVKHPTTTAIVDLLTASRAVLADLGVEPEQLFVNGWSQGGLNTQWNVQHLERLQIPMAAAAAQSPFNALQQTAIWWLTRTMNNPVAPLDPGPWVPLCASLLLASYESWFGLTGLFDAVVKDVVIPNATDSQGKEVTNQARVTYREILQRFVQFGDAVVKFGPPSIFSNDAWQVRVIRDNQEIWTTIPGFAGEEMLLPGVLDQPAGVVQEFLEQLQIDSPTNWIYGTPFKAWYGTKDEALPEDLVDPGMADGGGPKMSLVPVEGASHRQTFINALYASLDNPGGTDQNLIDWFNSFRKTTDLPIDLQLSNNTLEVYGEDFGILPLRLQVEQQQGERPCHVQVFVTRKDDSSVLIGSFGGTSGFAGQLQSLGAERLLLQVGESLDFQLLSRDGLSIVPSTTEIRPRVGGVGFDVILKDATESQAEILRFSVSAAPQDLRFSALDRIAAPQSAPQDGLLQLHAGQILNLRVTSDSAFTNTLGFVKLNLDPVTGLPLSSVGAQAIDISSDAFRENIFTLLDPGFQHRQGGRVVSSPIPWSVAEDGIYAAVLITPQGNVFCASSSSSDQQMLRLGQNRFGFEDLKGSISDYDWNDLVVDILSLN